MKIDMRIFGSREQWLAARKSYLGGSDAACVLGLNPWKTNVELWEEKTGRRTPPDISDSEAVRYGQKAEASLRQLFKLDYPTMKVSYRRENMWTNDAYPFAHASLDGWLHDELGRLGALEIKTTTISSKAQSDKWKGRIPDNYFCQVLWYMGVTNATFAILQALIRYEFPDKEPSASIQRYRIDRTDEIDEQIRWLMDEGRKFAEFIKNDERPPLRLPEV